MGEQMNSACVFPAIKHGGGGVLLLTLSVIDLEFTLNQHGYNSILQLYAIPSGLGLVGLSFVFINYYKKIIIIIVTFTSFSWYRIGSYSLVSSLQLPYGLGRGEG